MSPDTASIQEHMEVRSSDDHHVGRVDHVKGSEIELAKWDIPGLGKHHYIPLSWVHHVDKHVHLSKTMDEVKNNWRTD